MRHVLLWPLDLLEGCWLWQGCPVAGWLLVGYLWGQLCQVHESLPASVCVCVCFHRGMC